MKDIIIDYLQEEKQRLEKLLQSAIQDKDRAPEGCLRVARKGDHPEFYHRASKEDRLGCYIHKDRIDIAQALAQKTYADRFIKSLNPKLDLIDSIIHEYETNQSEEVYTRQSEIRQSLIKPYLIKDTEFAKRWLGIPYEPNPKFPEKKDQKTANGEWVRSKSEVIIADNLKMLGIPYKYEAPVKIPATSEGNAYHAMVEAPSSLVYPDFTCLNVRRRKLVYIEHFGIIDSPEYRDREFFWKIRNYESAGIIQGRNFIMTFEDDDHTFNFANYRCAIEELLLM